MAEADKSSYTYEGDLLIHTDPATGFQYKWNAEEKKWEPRTTNVSSSEEAATSSATTNQPQYERVGDTYIYKDEKTGQLLEWNLEAKEWRPKVSSGIATSRPPKIKRHNSDEEFDSDDSTEEKLLEQKKADINHHVTVLSNGVKTYTDPADGTVFEWDEDKKAWFPKLDDEFIARYQLSYGSNTVDTAAEVEQKAPVPSKSAGEDKKQPSEPNWFEIDQTKNTKVYVTNLPLDITEESLADFMQKCGLVEKDLETGKFKIKLYRDANGEVKGDALCTYIKVSCCFFFLKIIAKFVPG